MAEHVTPLLGPDQHIYCDICQGTEFKLQIGVEYRFDTATGEVFQPQQQEDCAIICIRCQIPVTETVWPAFRNNETFRLMMALNGYGGGTNPEHHWANTPPILEDKDGEAHR